MKRTIRIGLRGWIAMALLLIGCDSQTTANPHVARDSAGVQIDHVPLEDQIISREFVEIASIGGRSDTTLALSRVRTNDVAGSPSGTVFVLNTYENRIEVMGADGSLGRPIGSEGPGPGEMLRPSSISLSASGDIAVYDREKNALLSWSQSGEFVDERTLSVNVRGGRVHETEDGLVLGVYYAGTGEATGQRLILMKPDTTLEITRFTRLPSKTRTPHFPSCPSYGVEAPPLFAHWLLWETYEDLIIVVPSEEYRINIYRGDDLIRSIRRPFDPVEVTESVARNEAEPIVIPSMSCEIPPEEVVQVRGVSPVFPAIADIEVSPTGNLWIQRNVPGVEEDPIDIITLDGNYLGTLPPGSPFPEAFNGEEQIVNLEEDQFDVPVIELIEVHGQ